ncbi:hypothetical protein [Algoriphagus sp. Y33]|uniref:hypothetical protein n=1 Tax=Algoriphagus sp. Y33 TaxID=2772483 RepID=UPI001CE10FDC|nr:hypothetical protein [Algoriphagus sp. Y33]
MASDAKVATEFAVQNNTREQFQPLSSTSSDPIPQESFSSRNVNPDYIARYQAAEDTIQDDIVYFDEGAEQESNPDINAYDNYRVNGSGNNSIFNNSMAFNMGMMYGMNAGMMYGMNPWGMGGFYDPFWGPSFGYRPGFNLNIGFGFGFGNGFYRPMYMRPGFGYGGFYDPWGMPMYGWGGYPGYGYGRPIYVLPGGEYGNRRVVTGARPTRGSSLAGARGGNVSNAALQPSTARAQARRDVLNNRSNTSTRRVISNSDNSRVSARDFSSSQNDYYNSRAREGSSRNVSSAAMDRPVSRTRSAMPSARPSVGTTNSRTINSGRGGAVRSSYPATNTRTSSPSYNRSNVPSRSSSPAYNRGGTNTRTVTPTRSTPVRSTPSYSAPSRSSGSSGGATRSSSGSSRGGRGN